MLFQAKHEDHLGLLADQLRHAQAVTPALVSGLAETCTRIAALDRNQARARIDGLIASEAWTEVALALVELELPEWKLRRLLREDGEWFCSLSKHPNMPVEFDDTVDASHEVLPLAILAAFIEARRDTHAVHEPSSAGVPRMRPTPHYAVCCDNFA